MIFVRYDGVGQAFGLHSSVPLAGVSTVQLGIAEKASMRGKGEFLAWHGLRIAPLMVDSVVRDNLNLVRALLSGLVFLGTVGCSDMLGLGGLTYDQGLEETEPAEEPFQSADLFDLGPGGKAGVEDSVQDLDFPAWWPSEVQLATLPAQGQGRYYWVYFPDSRQLRTYLFQPSGPDLIAENDWPEAWPEEAAVSELLAFNDGGAPLLAAYSKSGLLMRMTDVLRAGDLSVEMSPGASKELSHVRAIKYGQHNLIFSYDSADGDYRCVPAGVESEALSGVGQLESGFSHVESYSVGQDEGLLFYEAGEGRLEFWAFRGEGVELELLYTGVIDFPVSEIVTSYGQFGEGILFYDTAQGLARVRRLTAVGDTLELTEYGGSWQEFENEAYLPQGLTGLVPVTDDDWALLGFNGETASVFGGLDASLNPIVVK